MHLKPLTESEEAASDPGTLDPLDLIPAASTGTGMAIVFQIAAKVAPTTV
jgi:hypothetical protein